jgi:pilus assembly protein TadC
MRARQDEIQRGLPDALDMLSVCASAGLGFDQSLQYISQYWDTEFGRELQRATGEMEMGVSRAEALRHMSARLDVDDLTRFIATIVQAERIGMSYATCCTARPSRCAFCASCGRARWPTSCRARSSSPWRCSSSPPC